MDVSAASSQKDGAVGYCVTGFREMHHPEKRGDERQRLVKRLNSMKRMNWSKIRDEIVAEMGR